ARWWNCADPRTLHQDFRHSSHARPCRRDYSLPREEWFLRSEGRRVRTDIVDRHARTCTCRRRNCVDRPDAPPVINQEVTMAGEIGIAAPGFRLPAETHIGRGARRD